MKANEIYAAGYNVAIDCDLTRLSEEEMSPKRQKLYLQMNGTFHVGTVLNYGPQAITNSEWCPEITNKENTHAVIGDFDGHNPPTKDKYVKIVPANSIVAMLKRYDEDMTVNDIVPTGERIVVQIINEAEEVNGVKVEEDADPREGQVQTAVVLKVSEGASKIDGNVKEGSVVSFDPYVGNLLIHTQNVSIKTLNVRDILYFTK